MSLYTKWVLTGVDAKQQARRWCSTRFSSFVVAGCIVNPQRPLCLSVFDVCLVEEVDKQEEIAHDNTSAGDSCGWCPGAIPDMGKHWPPIMCRVVITWYSNTFSMKMYSK